MGIYLGGMDLTWPLPVLALLSGLLIAHFMAGKKGRMVLIAWGFAPFLAYLVYSLLPGNGEFLAWMLVVLPFVAILWLPALLLGAWIGRRLRRAKAPLG